MKKIIVLIIVVLLIGFFWFRNDAPPTSDTMGDPLPKGLPLGEGVITTPPAPTTPAPNTMSTESVKEFTILGSNYSFTPNTLEVNKGDTVKITFQNANGFHNFTIDELAVATKQIKSGESEIVEFVTNKIGSFEYYCSVGNHRAMGMKGTLTVK